MKKVLSVIFWMFVLFIIIGLMSPEKDLKPITTALETSAQEEKVSSKPNVPKEDKFEFIALIKDTSVAKMKTALKEMAKEEWEDDYSMVEYIYNNQVESYEKVMKIINHPDLKGSINEKILEAALVDWGLDFDMVIYIYEDQLESYNNMK